MFKRRHPRKIMTHIREFFWPSMGWYRFFKLLKIRVLRLRDTPRNIAVGLASGASFSFSPFMGTHILQAAGFSFMARGNILAAVIGTLFGNPWTFPFIWFVSLYAGLWISKMAGFPIAPDLINDLSVDNVWHVITTAPRHILWPWIMGGYVLTVLTYPIFYGISYVMIKNVQTTRASLSTRPKQKRANKT